LPPVSFLTSLVENLANTRDRAEMLKTSYRDFHAKGLDYINLHRSPTLTIKAYIMNDEVPVGVNVVNPHDHAYDFSTFILSGCLANVNYTFGTINRKWFHHYYKTSLEGESNIKYHGGWRDGLKEHSVEVYGPGQHYYLKAEQVHTIRAATAGVIMLLFQYKHTEIAKERGTSLWLPSLVTPKLDGLYNRFTDETLEDALFKLDGAIKALKDR